MSPNASVLTAATTLVDWAHQRRRQWTDEPLPVRDVRNLREIRPFQEVPQVLSLPEVPEVPEVPAVPAVAEVHQFQQSVRVAELPEFVEVAEPEETMFSGAVSVDEPSQLPHFGDVQSDDVVGERLEPFEDFEQPEVLSPAFLESASFEPEAAIAPVAESVEALSEASPIAVEPQLPAVASRVSWTELLARCFAGLRVAGSFVVKAGLKVGDAAVTALESVGPWTDVALWCLTRGAALVSVVSVVALLALHRADVFSHWNRLTETVAAAAAATRPVPPPPVVLPAGSGRLVIASADDNPQVIVDGKPHGPTPVSLILPAGAHRLVLRGPKGSIERTVRVEAGETADFNEEIFPGWVAVASAIDLTLSENGRTLKRDERGWAILPPGPHDVHLDNESLGIHETRHVVVTPGDATRISLAPPSSSLSITTNEPAEVWVDGTSLGEAPITDTPMKLGMHDVRVRSAAHERWLRVRVTTQPTQLTVDLTAE